MKQWCALYVFLYSYSSLGPKTQLPLAVLVSSNLLDPWLILSQYHTPTLSLDIINNSNLDRVSARNNVDPWLTPPNTFSSLFGISEGRGVSPCFLYLWWWMGVLGDILVSSCPSVRLWTKSFPLCIFHNTYRIHHINLFPVCHEIHRVNLFPVCHGIHRINQFPVYHGIHCVNLFPVCHEINRVNLFPVCHEIHRVNLFPVYHGIHRVNLFPVCHGIHRVNLFPVCHKIHRINQFPVYRRLIAATMINQQLLSVYSWYRCHGKLRQITNQPTT